jgi:hypothetical protein
MVAVGLRAASRSSSSSRLFIAPYRVCCVKRVMDKGFVTIVLGAWG